MTDCCKTSNSSRGPPEWIRRKLEARISRDRGMGCPSIAGDCNPRMQFPTPYSRRTPYEHVYTPHDLYDTCERFSCCRDSEPSMLHHKPPFWLRNRCHSTNTLGVNADCYKGPPKSVIIEMLRLKRDYLNSTLNSLDSHIKKLNERDNIPEKE